MKGRVVEEASLDERIERCRCLRRLLDVERERERAAVRHDRHGVGELRVEVDRGRAQVSVRLRRRHRHRPAPVRRGLRRGCRARRGRDGAARRVSIARRSAGRETERRHDAKRERGHRSCRASPHRTQISTLPAGDNPRAGCSSPPSPIPTTTSCSTSTAASGSASAARRGRPRRSPRSEQPARTVVFLTNDARRSPEEYVRKLWSLGVQASLEEVVTVGAAIQYVLAERTPGTTHVRDRGAGDLPPRRRRRLADRQRHAARDPGRDRRRRRARRSRLRRAARRDPGRARRRRDDRGRARSDVPDRAWDLARHRRDRRRARVRDRAQRPDRRQAATRRCSTRRWTGSGPVGRWWSATGSMPTSPAPPQPASTAAIVLTGVTLACGGAGGERSGAGGDRRRTCTRCCSHGERRADRQPVGRRRPRRRVLPDVRAALDELGIEHHVELTRSLDHARALARAALAAGETAVAFGGDGAGRRGRRRARRTPTACSACCPAAAATTSRARSGSRSSRAARAACSPPASCGSSTSARSAARRSSGSRAAGSTPTPTGSPTSSRLVRGQPRLHVRRAARAGQLAAGDVRDRARRPPSA